MPWWGWMILGGFLLASELLLIDAAFYLVFVGVAAIITGFGVLLSLVPLAEWVQWLAFAALSVVTMLLFRERLYRRLRPAAIGFDGAPDGQQITLGTALAPGDSASAQWQGSTWKVTNEGEEPIPAGGRARILRRRGLGFAVASEPANDRAADASSGDRSNRRPHQQEGKPGDV
jgi:membrane protein implicated in regulation of membrane protease activity